MILLAQTYERNLPLLLTEEFEESCPRKQQCVGISIVQVGPGERVGTDHFQTVAAGFVSSSMKDAVSIAFSTTCIWLCYSLK